MLNLLLINNIRCSLGHTCIMDIEALKAELIEHQIMEDCSLPDSVLSLDQAHNVSISTLPVDISSRLRTPLQMRSKLNKRKKKLLPDVPDIISDVEIPEQYSMLSYKIEGQPNVLKAFFQEKILIDRPDHSIETILIFATDEFLRLLFRSEVCYADGTFYISPYKLKQ